MNRLRFHPVLALAIVGVGATACAGESDEPAKGKAPSCTSTPPGMLCVHGTPSSSGQDMLAVGDRLHVQVSPGGCHSSSCTVTEVASCSISGSGPAFRATSEFCLRSEGDVCTDDCGGGDSAECEGPMLAAGPQTVELGSLRVSFTVPGLLDPDTSCAYDL